MEVLQSFLLGIVLNTVGRGQLVTLNDNYQPLTIVLSTASPPKKTVRSCSFDKVKGMNENIELKE